MSVGLTQIQGILDRYGSGGMNQGVAASQIVDIANTHGYTPESLGERFNMDPNSIRRTADQFNLSFNTPTNQSGSNYGLSAAESGITTGLNAATGSIGRGISGLSSYNQYGKDAHQLQAALSGALGPEAQAEAYANYQESPGVEFARNEAERAILRNSAALGAVSSGNTLDQIGRNAVGTYLQDFDNQFYRLSDVANRGLSAGQAMGSLYGQQAGLQFQGGQNLGELRYRTGQDVNSSIAQTSSALADLANQSGAINADIVGQGYTDMNALIEAAFNGDAQAMENLGVLLGNLNMSAAGQNAGVPYTPAQPANTLDTIARVSGGISGLTSGGGSTPQYNASNTPSRKTDWGEFSQWVNNYHA